MPSGMNGLCRIDLTSSRTLSSRSPKGMKSMWDASMPVSAVSLPHNSSLENVSIPQSVWWITRYSLVPSSCEEMMRLRNADLEAEEALRMEPGVHAGQDSNPAGRRHRLARLIEVGGVAAVVVEQDLSGAHDGSFYPFEWLAWWLAI